MTASVTRPRILMAIAALIALTIFRAQTLLFLPKLEMFGGTAPDAWFAPWVSDAVFGLLVPVMAYLAVRGRGVRTLILLVAYNAIGAFDYATGLATQWQSPLPAEIAPPLTVYLGIGVFMILQLIALALLCRQDVLRYFLSTEKWASYVSDQSFSPASSETDKKAVGR